MISLRFQIIQRLEPVAENTGYYYRGIAQLWEKRDSTYHQAPVWPEISPTTPIKNGLDVSDLCVCVLYDQLLKLAIDDWLVKSYMTMEEIASIFFNLFNPRNQIQIDYQFLWRNQSI